jgi:hypothetical protein
MARAPVSASGRWRIPGSAFFAPTATLGRWEARTESPKRRTRLLSRVWTRMTFPIRTVSARSSSCSAVQSATGIVASLCEIIDSSGRLVRGPEPWRLGRRSVFVPFAHGAMMYRRDIFDHVGGYRQECEFWEDQDLIVRMAAISLDPEAFHDVSTEIAQSACRERDINGAAIAVATARSRGSGRPAGDQSITFLEGRGTALAGRTGRLDP